MKSVILVVALVSISYLTPAFAVMDVYDCIMSGHIGCA